MRKLYKNLIHLPPSVNLLHLQPHSHNKKAKDTSPTDISLEANELSHFPKIPLYCSVYLAVKMHHILNDDPDALTLDTTPELQEKEYLHDIPRQTRQSVLFPSLSPFQPPGPFHG